jgi:hypothetical protein
MTLRAAGGRGKMSLATLLRWKDQPMTKRLAAPAVVALKEALCCIYWYKADLRSFLQHCVTNRSHVGQVNWGNYKRQIVSDFVDLLCDDQDRYLTDLLKLCREVASMDEFRHLDQLEGGDQKSQRARQAVEQLRQMVKPHHSEPPDEEVIAERQRQYMEKLKASAAVREKLKSLKQRYTELVLSKDTQGRGYELERIMYDIFELFDLDPKASFKNTGEQIDGAFALQGTDYLFEAKWEKIPISIGDLDGFAGKVNRKLDNTLGLFLSINGFSSDAVSLHSSGRPSIILMHGADLMAVLDEQIDFVTLLVRKRRHAAQTGNIYLPVQEIS